MPARSVVETLNVIKDIGLGQFAGFVDAFLDPLFLQTTKELLGHGVVPAEAEALLTQAIRIWEQVLGPRHPAVARALSQLALLYLEQERLAEAETLQRRSTEILERALGPQHPDLATALGNLALVYVAQGKPVQAEALNRRARAIREQRTIPSD